MFNLHLLEWLTVALVGVGALWVLWRVWRSMK